MKIGASEGSKAKTQGSDLGKVCENSSKKRNEPRWGNAGSPQCKNLCMFWARA